MKALDRDQREALLNSVLPEYRSIAKADPYNETDPELYKAINAFGDIYLIQNPAAWKLGSLPDGSGLRIRLKPQLKLSRAQADKAKNEFVFEPGEPYTPPSPQTSLGGERPWLG